MPDIVVRVSPPIRVTVNPTPPINVEGVNIGAPGASAYDIAVANGFSGTEAEWLASLDGTDGTDGGDGREIEIGVSATHIQWRYVGEATWTDLLPLTSITGPQGEDGAPGAPGADGSDGLPGADGDDGREIELQANATHLQWRYVGDVTWTDLIALSVITGPAGADGADAVYATNAQAQGMTLTDVALTPANIPAVSVNTNSAKNQRLVRYGASDEVFLRLTPTNNYEAASKYYVDGKGISNLASYAELDALTDSGAQFGKVLIPDVETSLGFAGYEFVGGTFWFQSVPMWTNGVDDVWGVWFQRLTIPDVATGVSVVVERSRIHDGSSWVAWSAWAVVTTGGGGGAPDGTFRTYASTTELDNVETAEWGIYRFADSSELQTFFGPGGTNLFFGAEVLFASYLSDNYGSGFPPVASGRIQQVAEAHDGYGFVVRIVRSRGYDSGTSTWSSWGDWSVLPLAGFRPTAISLFQGGPAEDGSDDGWVEVTEQTSYTGLGESEEGSSEDIAQTWSTWWADASRHAIEGGELRVKSASFEFDGILDGTKTDVGTVGFGARGTANLTLQTNRVDAEASAAGAAAVAGFSIPIGIVNRYGGLFHATFSMQGGISSNTRLLCGLVATADIAAAMADNDPASMQNFFAAGYGSADAGVSVFQKATGAMSTGASAQAPSTSANQLIDFKAWWQANSGALRYILSIRTSSTIVKKNGVLGNNPANSLPLSFFLRASAGGTSAQPKVGLHRLRVGSGFGTSGGF